MSSAPSDFEVEIISEGRMPDTPRYKLTIKSNGGCSFSYQADQKSPKASTKEFHLDRNVVDDIHSLIKNSEFFQLTSHDSGVLDGDQVQLKVTMYEKIHTVLLVNYPLDKFDNIIREINSMIPKEFQISYNSLVLGEGKR